MTHPDPDKNRQVFEFPVDWAQWSDEEKDAWMDELLDALGAPPEGDVPSEAPG